MAIPGMGQVWLIEMWLSVLMNTIYNTLKWIPVRFYFPVIFIGTGMTQGNVFIQHA